MGNESSNLAEIAARIKQLKQERKALILAHLYQRPEIQEIADVVGDSLLLAQKAAATDAEVIVLCGVYFMAETAKILSPDKTVLLPEPNAGCPMADMVTAQALRQRKAELNNPVVVCYVNSAAEVKAESDICCTSSNAVEVIKAIEPGRDILFVPDKNLGQFVAQKAGRQIHLWPGYCNTHDRVTPEEIQRLKETYPNAPVLVHPECDPAVVALADGAFSTSGIINYVEKSNKEEFIIGTELGIMYQLETKCPDKQFHLASERLICPNMKSTTLPKVLRALETMEPQIAVSEVIRERAIASLERMLAIG